MTGQEIIVVKKSWGIFRNIDPVLIGDVFYSRVFYKAPALKKMFPASMDGQYKKMIDMLSVMVARLERVEELSTDISELARRHVAYGVKAWHYAIVGDALLWTLEQGLGRDWTAEVKDAWASCYQMLAGAMIAAADKTN